MDMSADKVKVICDKISENKNSIMKTGTDHPESEIQEHT